MPRKAMEILTETMFYLLLVLRTGDLCGTDCAAKIEACTGGRVRVGPATLYTLLAKFEKEKLIREIAVEGRKRTYAITPKGEQVYVQELNRLQRCVEDARALEQERKEIGT